MSLKTFNHGIHPSYNKELTQSKKIEKASLPSKVVIPLQQHIGAPCKPLIKKGDMVAEGQKIGEATTFVTAPVHSSISGKVKEIERLPYPGGGKVLSVIIEGDGTVKDWGSGDTDLELESLSKEELKNIIREAGIVGMGGAAFPTHVKLSPPKEKKIDAFILNGCECEPYLTSDHRLMVEEPEKVLRGMKAMMRAIGVENGFIGIEENKPDAIDALERVTRGSNIKVVVLKTKYPQGAEKMLVKAVIDRKVPVGKLPMDVGCVVNNVGTAFAVYEAVKYKKPLIERVITVSGNGVREPKNLLVRIGTSFEDVLNQCGGMAGEGEKEVLNGGPMMGIAQTTLEAPVIKGTSGITVLTGKEIKPFKYDPCIRCASCVEVCPVNLMPYKLGDLGRLYRLDEFKAWGGMTCIECGCCSYTCPSKRPLLHWIRVGKVKIREKEKV
ncbi:MAG TPA: electron transport complex subunit RsxC [Thermodesulfobacteriota bacterium]|nr:electron transport complex subunit RsxC [Thermodesulfobacteriota bacterium]